MPFSEYKRHRGDRVRLHSRIPNVQGRRQVRHVALDTNFWKSFVHARLAVASAFICVRVPTGGGKTVMAAMRKAMPLFLAVAMAETAKASSAAM